MRVLFAIVFVLLAIEGGVVAWLVGGVVFGLSGGSSLAADSPSGRVISPGAAQATPDTLAADPRVWDYHGPINILLLGLDTGECGEESYTKATRTDTIILVRIDPKTGRAAMLSIPRDLYVYIGYVPATGDDEGAAKINTAHAIGAAASPDDPNAGPYLLAQVIEENLELSVNRYVRIDFQGFKKLIDEGLGGLDMDLPASPDDATISLYDTNYPDGNCGTITVRFEPGPQHLDGTHVLQYARSRYSTSDFDRSRRQMEVLMALRSAARSPSVIPRLPRLVPIALDTVDTDLTAREILSLAPIARGMNPENIVSLRIDENVVYDDTVVIGTAAQSVLRLQQDRWDVLRAQFLSMSPPPPPATDTPPPVAPAPAD